jgi:hypothetical protein
MTDQQFRQLFAAQLAQIALLQAIEANVSFMAHKHIPTDRIRPSLKKTQQLLEQALNELAQGTSAGD